MRAHAHPSIWKWRFKFLQISLSGNNILFNKGAYINKFPALFVNNFSIFLSKQSATDISFRLSAGKFPHEVKFKIHKVSMQSRCTISWEYDQFEVSAKSELRLKLFCGGLTPSKILLLKSQIKLLRFLRDTDLSQLSCLIFAFNTIIRVPRVAFLPR